MLMKIDYDRGVLKRLHPSGVEVYMYLDSPGQFLSAHETPVAESLAREAGFDVVELGKKRLMKERMSDAMAKITAEMDLGEKEKTVVMERNGFKLVDIGLNRHQVESPDGTVLNDIHLPLDKASELLEKLTPDL